MGLISAIKFLLVLACVGIALIFISAARVLDKELVDRTFQEAIKNTGGKWAW